MSSENLYTLEDVKHAAKKAVEVYRGEVLEKLKEMEDEQHLKSGEAAITVLATQSDENSTHFVNWKIERRCEFAYGRARAHIMDCVPTQTAIDTAVWETGKPRE